MAHQVEEAATHADDLNSIPGTPMVDERTDCAKRTGAINSFEVAKNPRIC